MPLFSADGSIKAIHSFYRLGLDFCSKFIKNSILRILWSYHFPSEATADCKIHAFNIAVNVVHCADYIYIFRHIKTIIEIVAFINKVLVLRFNCAFFASITWVNGEKQLAENF